MNQTYRLLIVLLGLLLLGALGLLLGAWADRWPRVRYGFIRAGDAAITVALGFIGLWLVIVVFRAIGWLPPPQ